MATPQPPVLVDPPLLVVEILSGYNTYTEIQKRSSDYLRMGVKNIWIVDPEAQTGQMYADGAWITASRLEIPGTLIYVDLPDLFQYIDKPMA